MCGTVEIEAQPTVPVFITWFDCPKCDGHGSEVLRDDDGKVVAAELCKRCKGEGKLGATEEDVEAAQSIGSDNPFCIHDWAVNEESDRCYCLNCGADGDA